MAEGIYSTYSYISFISNFKQIIWFLLLFITSYFLFTIMVIKMIQIIKEEDVFQYV